VPDGVTALSPRLSGPDDLLALASEGIDGVDALVVGLPPEDGELQQAAAAIADHAVELGGRLPRWARDRVAAVRRLGPPVTPAQLARTARVVSGRAVGLALSSGGSKTVAHIGVVRVLREAGITIDAIAGTSGGSITAACLALGADHDTIVERMRELPEAFRYRRLVPRFPPRLSLFRGANVVHIFERWFGDADLSTTAIPLYVVTADVATGEEVVLRRGPVALAVRASMGIPAVFPPVAWDGRWLTDGGIVTPLPTGPLRDAGIARVIASNVAGQDPTVRSTPTRAPRLVETIGRIVAAMEREVLGPEMALADVQIRPVVRAANSFDFRKADDYLAEGERAAREMLPAVEALVRG
jgi:NTE family protein